MSTGRIAKPILRGHVKGKFNYWLFFDLKINFLIFFLNKAYIIKSFLISCGLGLTGGYLYKVLVADPRKKSNY